MQNNKCYVSPWSADEQSSKYLKSHQDFVDKLSHAGNLAQIDHFEFLLTNTEGKSTAWIKNNDGSGFKLRWKKDKSWFCLVSTDPNKLINENLYQNLYQKLHTIEITYYVEESIVVFGDNLLWQLDQPIEKYSDQQLQNLSSIWDHINNLYQKEKSIIESRISDTIREELFDTLVTFMVKSKQIQAKLDFQTFMQFMIEIPDDAQCVNLISLLNKLNKESQLKNYLNSLDLNFLNSKSSSKSV